MAPGYAILPVFTARVSISWIALFFLLLICALGGAWWSWLRSSVPAKNPQDEDDRVELAMLRAVVASLPDLIYVKDARSRFLLANQATVDAMGAINGQELLGKTDFDFFPEQLAAGFFTDEQRVIRTGQPVVSQDEHILERDGRTRWMLTTKVPLNDAVGQPVGIVGIGRNVTPLKELEAELRETQKRLEFKATHDALTGLLNRGAILEALEREFARGQRNQCPIALLLGDLDYFKRVNDSHGHLVGDEVLCEVAKRMQSMVRRYDVVGRYGGEEFLVVFSNCASADAILRANHLRGLIGDAPIPTGRGPIPMTISFGVLATDGLKCRSVEQALHEADLVLYAAKAAGRNQCKLAGMVVS